MHIYMKCVITGDVPYCCPPSSSQEEAFNNTTTPQQHLSDTDSDKNTVKPSLPVKHLVKKFRQLFSVIRHLVMQPVTSHLVMQTVISKIS